MGLSSRPTLVEATKAAKSAVKHIHRDYMDDAERAGIQRLIEHAERSLYR